MDPLTELRSVWYGFYAGQVGPDAVVVAARRACSAGVHQRAPSLVQLASLRPEQFGYAGAIFERVRGELLATAPVPQRNGQPVAPAGAAAVVDGSLKPWQRGGLDKKQRRDLKLAGWVCVVAGLFWLWGLGVAAIVIGALLNINDDDHGGPMVLLAGFVILLGIALRIEPFG